MPHAIDVDGYIITMFDPINHERLDEAEDDVDPHRGRRRAIAAGSASAARSSSSAAS